MDGWIIENSGIFILFFCVYIIHKELLNWLCKDGKILHNILKTAII